MKRKKYEMPERVFKVLVGKLTKDDVPYEEWMHALDWRMRRTLKGIGVDDLGDFLWRDNYDNGSTIDECITGYLYYVEDTDLLPREVLELWESVSTA